MNEKEIWIASALINMFPEAFEIMSVRLLDGDWARCAVHGAQVEVVFLVKVEPDGGLLPSAILAQVIDEQGQASAPLSLTEALVRAQSPLHMEVNK